MESQAGEIGTTIRHVVDSLEIPHLRAAVVIIVAVLALLALLVYRGSAPWWAFFLVSLFAVALASYLATHGVHRHASTRRRSQRRGEITS